MDVISLFDRQVDVSLDPDTQKRINEIGRTEDIKLSYDNKRMAISGFLKECILIMDIEIINTEEKKELKVLDSTILVSRHLHKPHGIEFWGNDFLIVANRDGYISLFDIRKLPGKGAILSLKAYRTVKYIGLFKKIHSPGSLGILRQKEHEVDILVCNNYAHLISKHTISLNAKYNWGKNSIFLSNGLNIPDGICISNDRSWLGISDHQTQRVLIFDLRQDVQRNAAYCSELIDAGYPHGIRFSGSGRQLFVADAGSPYVYVYQSSEDWKGIHQPSQKWKVLTESEFQAGSISVEEGGPKGIDVTLDQTFLVVTNQEAPLRIFYIKDLVGT